jgi:hypothetical protein
MNKKKLSGFFAGFAGLAAAIVAARQPHSAPVEPSADTVAMWNQTCHAVVQENAHREDTTDERNACLALARGGKDVVGLRAWADGLPKAEPPAPEAPEPPPVVALQPLHADGRIFRTADGQPFRWKGVSAFQLLDRYVRGEDLAPFLNAYRGFNVLRVWPYVPVSDWGDKAWGAPPAGVIRDFIAAMGSQGFYVELTLLTSDDAEHLAWAQAIVPQVTDGGCPAGLLLEAGNEPTTHKSINTAALRGVLAASGCLYASGDYEDSSRAFGSYLVAHTSRDASGRGARTTRSNTSAAAGQTHRATQRTACRWYSTSPRSCRTSAAIASRTGAPTSAPRRCSAPARRSIRSRESGHSRRRRKRCSWRSPRSTA